MGSRRVQLQGMGRSGPAKSEEDSRSDDQIQQGGGNQSPHNNNGYRMQNFLAGLMGGKQERDERSARCQ